MTQDDGSHTEVLLAWQKGNDHKRAPRFTGGNGPYIRLDDGSFALDWNSGAMSTNLGHHHPHIWKRIREYYEQKKGPDGVVPLAGSSDSAHDLAKKLKTFLPRHLNNFIFLSSGTEANSQAIQIAWKYGGENRKKILVRVPSYHGGASLALEASGDPRSLLLPHVYEKYLVKVKAPHLYSGNEEEQVEASIGELEKVIREHKGQIGIMIAETVIGTAGVYPPPKNYWKRVCALLEEYNIVLILDEVMCGLGRVGAATAAEIYEAKADIMTLGKSLSAGIFPISAICLSEEIAQKVIENQLPAGSTFSNHPLGCVIAKAALEVMEGEQIFDYVRGLESYMRAHMEQLVSKYNICKEFRLVGLFGAVELQSDTHGLPFTTKNSPVLKIQKKARDKGLLITCRPNIIMCNPPLIIKKEEIDEAFEILDKVFAEIEPPQQNVLATNGLKGTLFEKEKSRLQKIVKHVLKSSKSDFYKEHFKELAVHSRFPKNKSEWERVPLLTKKHITALDVYKRLFIDWGDVFGIRTTSNTTGRKPLTTARRTFGDYGKVPALAGVKRQVSFQHAWYLSEISRRESGMISINCDHPISPEWFAFSARMAKLYRANSFLGWPQLLISLAPYLEKENIIKNIDVLEVFGDRMSLAQRDTLLDAYNDPVIFQNYSSSESSGLFGVACEYTIENKLTSFHLLNDYLFWEFIDPDTTLVVKPTKEKAAELVVTTLLENQPFPVIRYRTGDLFLIEEEHCQCGHESPRFVMVGRTDKDVMKFITGELSVLRIEEAIANSGSKITEDFELHWHEILGEEGSVKPQFELRVIPKEAHFNMERFARQFAEKLPITGGRTYADLVKDNVCLPMLVTSMREPTLTPLGKRLRIFRHAEHVNV
jgi:taurine---2-oxoglutarate transaminase